MIFVTVGTQLPFDRLAKAMDEVAPQIDEPVIGQIGTTDYRPLSYEALAHLEPALFAERFRTARVVVSHAGTGTVLAAMRHGKPLILMARKAKLGEHRNDHQTDTCARLGQLQGVHVAETSQDILRFLTADLQPMQDKAPPQRQMLIDRLRSAIGQ